MTPDERISFLESRLDHTLMLLLEIVRHTDIDNDMLDYFTEKIDEIYYM